MVRKVLRSDIKRLKLPKLIIYSVIVFVTVCMVFPLYWMFITAFKPANEVTSIPPLFFPSRFVFGNLVDTLRLAPFEVYFKNSVIVTATAILITVSINLLAGFAFAKYNFRGKNALFLIVLSTLMVPMQVTMIPNFIILSKLSWLNSYIGLIIPQCAEAFGLFLARQFISEIPDELLEATRIDGGGELIIFRKIIIPNCKALTAVLIIFTFMWRWNDFLWPLIVVNDSQYYTVQIGLSMLMGMHYVDWGNLMAASLVIVMPIIVVFLFFQKYFIQGITTTGLK